MTDPNEAPFASQVHQEPPTTPLTGLDQNTAAGLRGKFIESILQLVVQALTGIFTPGPIGGAVTQLATWATDIGGTITGMLSGIVTGTVSTVGGLLGGFLNALLGFGSNVIPAYTPANSAVANIQGQLNAILAQISTTGEGDVDGFNYPPLSPTDWVSIYNSAVVTGGGYVIAGHPGTSGAYYTCQRFDKSRPDTTLWQVQMTIVGTNTGGTMTLGISRFGGGADSTLSTRHPAVEFDVNPFGMFVRLGSLAGSPNDFNLGSLGWIEYGNVNVTSTIKNGDVLALEVDETSKLYNVYINPGPGSIPILTITDSGDTIPRGVGHRDAWFQLNVPNDPFGVGNGWDNFFVFDRL